ncbi:hypothetical protein ACGFIF_08925 [Kribbella sp. NPDC049174]|uniref:hypothetical protein n=1 Tax=Kribbella sp. NPDC049174 TaxID=3364112 RepID=UPI003714839A
MTLNRRDFLRVGGVAAAGAVAGSALSAAPAFAAEIDYTARTTFDDWDRLFQQGGPGQPDQPNDNTNADGRSGMLAWSQSYVLLGLVRMYETYRDTYYLLPRPAHRQRRPGPRGPRQRTRCHRLPRAVAAGLASRSPVHHRLHDSCR